MAGYSAGLDFEQKIIVKENAAELLHKELSKPSWKAAPIMFSGNTDCYQPIERKLKLTRACLEVLNQFKNPVGIITKNQLVLRDIDILSEMSEAQIVKVFVSITSMDKELRSFMEPRTASIDQRWKVVEKLAEAQIPVGVMMGPVIPGLNNHEIPLMVQKAAEVNAYWVGYSLVRLNGAVKDIFEDWIRKCYPDRAEKVLNQIRSCHGGKLNNSEFGSRMRGSGEIADSISQLFHLAKKKYFGEDRMPAYNLQAFRLPGDGQLSLF